MNASIILLAVSAGPWDVPTAQSSSAPAEPKWTRLTSPATFPADPYQDVHSLPCGYFYPDTHEQTHYVHAWLDNSWGLTAKRQRAIYCLQGRIAIIAEPPVTLRQVAEAVPVSQRRSLYQTYLIGQQSDRNDRPATILAEWACYANQFDADGRTPDFVTQWASYAKTLLTLAERCPGYDAGPLRTFVLWHTARVEAQAKSVRALITPLRK